MKDKDLLRLQQTEETVSAFRQLLNAPAPSGGWVRAIKEALGMTNVQLAKRLKLKAPQTIEDMQAYEASGTIKLHTLRKLAEALGCRVVYAVVPLKPLDEMRRDRAYAIANRQLRPVTHSMKLEAQGLSDTEEQKALERLVEELLNGNPKKLWE
jgi:predicted DNA-binding mobile mystery protein A